MKYQAPFGQPDANASYVDGNPGAGIQGSIPPAKSIEQPQREIVNALLGAGLVPSDTDLAQLWQAIQRNIPVGTAAGTANAITVTLSPAPLPLNWSTLRLFLVTITAANTGAATIAPNGLTARSIKMTDGTTDIGASALRAGGVALFANDGTNVQLIGMLDGGGRAVPLWPGTRGNQSWTAAGTYSWTPPAGVYQVRVNRIVGAGGKGGNDTGVGATGAGAGGSDAGVFSVTPGVPIAIQIGAGGATAGAGGGTTTFGSLISATGGGPGSSDGVSGGGSGVGVGGQESAFGGGGGSPIIVGSVRFGGTGGGSFFGSGGLPNGGQGSPAGTGGAGGGSANPTGGNGRDGYLSISW